MILKRNTISRLAVLVFVFLFFGYILMSLPQSKEIDHSSETSAIERYVLHIDSGKNDQRGSLSLENKTAFPLTISYDVIERFKTEYDESLLIVSPLILSPGKMTLVANYIPKPNMKQTGLGFSSSGTFANNKTNTSPLFSFKLPLNKNALVSQSPIKESRHFWMTKYNSHSGLNINAIDFKVPLGTPIYAIASGVVAFVYESSNIGCPEWECVKYGNTLEVLHDDGTAAIYTHLQKDSVYFEVGDRVKAEELVALSGDTGGGGFPHLHLEVSALRYDINNNIEIVTIPLKFQTDNGEIIELAEGDYIDEGKLIKSSLYASILHYLNYKN